MSAAGPFDPREADRARPARHIDQRARGSARNAPSSDEESEYRGDNVRPLAPLPSLGEIERRIMRCDDELADLVEQHYTAAEEAADAEDRWKWHRDRVLVFIADRGDKEAADIREARAKVAKVPGEFHDGDPEKPVVGEDLYRVYKILAARETSIDRHIRALQTRLTGLMSVAKGIRSVT